MTIEELIQNIQNLPQWLLLSILIVPVLSAWLAGLLHPKPKSPSPTARWLLSGLVYATCIPGLFAAVLTAYSLFFLGRNLLTLNVTLYFLPILTMFLTLILIGRTTPWKSLPGVDRLYAFMVLMGVSMMLALAIVKTRIWLFFGGGFGTLVILALFCFLVLRWALNRLFQGRSENAYAAADDPRSLFKP